MTATVEPRPQEPEATPAPALARAEGLELLGELHGSGYKDGASLVRRADGQVVQLGPLQYALLDCIDGRRDGPQLVTALSEKIGREVELEHVERIAQRLAQQGFLAGHEQNAPPKSNPLLALRWKYLITDPKLTRRMTQPFTALFRPWILWPVLVAFLGVVWFVLVQKGVASATAEAFNKPELLLLVFGLAVASAGFHELGHAAACRYGGGTPGGMGVGIYMVWPAFYTDVTDAYRLPKRDRLRTDLGGLYFNAVVGVVTLAAWLALRVDALLLLIALQLLQMVKQLSPMIRADGYHILADLTGVPDLFQHIGPTLKRLLPGHRNEPSALTGRARVLVTAWVLLIVPLLLALSLSAILVFPRLVATAWESGSQIASGVPRELKQGQVLDVLASVLRMLALLLPVLGVGLMSQRILRIGAEKANAWSVGRPRRRFAVGFATFAAALAIIWAWWPSGQYQAVQAAEGGTLTSLGRAITSPTSAARPQPTGVQRLTPGKHLAVAMIPQGGATKERPAFVVIQGDDGQKPVVLVTDQLATQAGQTGAPPSGDSGSTGTAPTAGDGPGAAASSATAPDPVPTTVFPFKLPGDPGPRGTQALAVNTKDGAIKYDIAYTLVTVKDGDPVDYTNAAYAIASCKACTTFAVSFQVVLVVGQTSPIAPINAAAAINYNCPECITAAIASQIVVTLKEAPSEDLLRRLNEQLKKLDALDDLGPNATPEQIAAQVDQIEQAIQTELQNSGLMTNPPKSTSTGTGTSTSPTGTGTSTTPSGSSSTDTTTTPAGSTGTTTSPTGTGTTTSPSDTGTSTTPTRTGTTTTDTATTPADTTTDTSTTSTSDTSSTATTP